MATAYVKKLKDVEQNTIYPVSTTAAIVNKEGVNLDSIHSTFVTAKHIENIETGNLIACETINNKVTSINAASTDVQYPTAKAVYTALNAAGLQVIKVDTLPAVETALNGVIYLIANKGTGDQDLYEEYLLVEVNGVKALEKIGNTTLNLAGYATEQYVQTAIANAIKAQTISQEDYDALQSYDLNTLYVIE